MERSPDKLEAEADRLIGHKRGDGGARRAQSVAKLGYGHDFSLSLFTNTDSFEPRDDAQTALEVYVHDLYRRAGLLPSEQALATHIIRGHSLSSAAGGDRGHRWRVLQVLWDDIRRRLAQAICAPPAGMWYFTYAGDVRRSRKPPPWTPPTGIREKLTDEPQRRKLFGS